MKIFKNRFLLTMLTVICVMVSTMSVAVSAAETDTLFYAVEEGISPESIVSAVFASAGVSSYDDAQYAMALNYADVLSGVYISADKKTVVFSDCYFEDILSVFYSEDAAGAADDENAIWNFKPKSGYKLDGNFYYPLSVPTKSIAYDSSESYTFSSFGPASEGSAAGSDLASVVNDKMMSSVLDEVLDLLPVVVVVIVGFVGLRKGIGFLQGILHNA